MVEATQAPTLTAGAAAAAASIGLPGAAATQPVSVPDLVLDAASGIPGLVSALEAAINGGDPAVIDAAIQALQGSLSGSVDPAFAVPAAQATGVGQSVAMERRQQLEQVLQALVNKPEISFSADDKTRIMLAYDEKTQAQQSAGTVVVPTIAAVTPETTSLALAVAGAEASGNKAEAGALGASVVTTSPPPLSDGVAALLEASNHKAGKAR